MQIFSTITNLTELYPNAVVALGTFDGVHVGHQNIIKKAIALAKSIQGTSMVFTFSNHPLGVISPKRCPPQIADNRYKEELMQYLGVDVLMNVPFTKDFLKLTPLAFLEILRDNLAPKYIVVGPNYSFGFRGEGNSSLLERVGGQFGFKSEIHPAVQVEAKSVSSTRIRSLIGEGNIREANKLLGARFKLRGKVVRGDQRGRLLGFPTANLAIDDTRATPPNGVYAVYAVVAGKRYNAIANIGTNPTFHGLHRHGEVHVLEFSDDIYGQEIEIEFIEKLRAEQNFENAGALIKQIKLDIAKAAEVCGLHRDIFVI